MDGVRVAGAGAVGAEAATSERAGAGECEIVTVVTPVRVWWVPRSAAHQNVRASRRPGRRESGPVPGPLAGSRRARDRGPGTAGPPRGDTARVSPTPRARRRRRGVARRGRAPRSGSTSSPRAPSGPPPTTEPATATALPGLLLAVAAVVVLLGAARATRSAGCSAWSPWCGPSTARSTAGSPFSLARDLPRHRLRLLVRRPARRVPADRAGRAAAALPDRPAAARPVAHASRVGVAGRVGRAAGDAAARARRRASSSAGEPVGSTELSPLPVSGRRRPRRCCGRARC